MKDTALDGMSPFNPFPRSSRDPLEEEVEKVYEPKGIEDIRRPRPSKFTEQSMNELSETDVTRTGPLWVYSRFSVYILQLLI